VRGIDRDGEGGDREGRDDPAREDGPESDLFAEIEALGSPRARGAEKSDAELIAQVLGQARARPMGETPVGGLLGVGWRRRGVVAALAVVSAAAAMWLVAEVETADDRDDTPVVAEEPSPSPFGETAAPPPVSPSPSVRLGEAETPPSSTLGGAETSPASPAPTGAPGGGLAPPASPGPDRLHGAGPSLASSDELLRRAQHLLQAGKTTEAIEAYRDLVALRPGSGEAHTALVSLGQLALDQGHAEEALAYLDRYVAGGGSLHEEASFLRIEALRRLGRTGEAATAVGEFLGRYPESVHAPRLRSATP
jgi:tetratricopeptide (TPR) repeat protein